MRSNASYVIIEKILLWNEKNKDFGFLEKGDNMNLIQMEAYRKQKGYSYEKLSDLSGIPEEMLRKIFRGETDPLEYGVMAALENVLKPENEVSTLKEAGAAYWMCQGNYTLDDYYALPDDRRAELIDGVIYDMSAPTTEHQLVLSGLSVLFANFIKKKKGPCIMLFAPVDVQLDCDNKTMVQPDLLILCDKSKVTKKCIKGAPDFVLEILSESTRKKDLFLKLHKYEEAGVREYWMADLQKKRVIVYNFEKDDIPKIYGMTEKVPVGIYGGELVIDFAEVEEALL